MFTTSAHFLYLRAADFAVQVNMSGSEGQFYLQHPNLCAYSYSPSPLPCYMVTGDLIFIVLGGFLSLTTYEFLMKRRY